MKCGYCGNDFAESQHHYCPEGQRFLLAELARLRAALAAKDAEIERLKKDADAALGRAVRRFSEGMALFKQNPEWAFRQGYSGDIIRRDTPEAALKAAGLMEVEK